MRAVPPAASLAAPAPAGHVGLGVDLGTSGVRVCVVQQPPRRGAAPAVLHEAASRWSDEDGAAAHTWVRALQQLLRAVDARLLERVDAVAVSGTSASVLLVDGATGEVEREARMYNYAVEGPAGSSSMDVIARHAPGGHAVRSRTSSLAKLLSWQFEQPLSNASRLVHQADYVAAALARGIGGGGKGGPREFVSDWHNALKLGFDVEALRWPGWLLGALGEAGVPAQALPAAVVQPGVGSEMSVSAAGRADFGLPEGCRVVGGTTDSIAAFLASGCDQVGQAVTSLGSTIAIKMLSDVKVDDAGFGIYSHRLDDAWLVGGASNVGCRIFRHLQFTDEELRSLSGQIDVPSEPENTWGYYPLVEPGERFPVNDPALQPRLEPRPPDRAEFLRRLLISMGDVERVGFAKLAELGAGPLREVRTAGGGSQNEAWRLVRERMLGVPVSRAEHSDAAYGAALLSLRGL